jgi:septum formation protein
VLTALALQAGRRRWAALQVSHVRFAPLPPAVIRAYVAGGEPFGKAGSYAIQGALAGWIAHIEGSHSGIMGLPLHQTSQLLRRAGVETGP